MEGELLKQRLQALENRTVLDLIEGKKSSVKVLDTVTNNLDKIDDNISGNNSQNVISDKEELEIYSDF